MGENSKIQWTHHTFNPWWGCVKVSPGCKHCYAETFSKRTGHNVWGVDAPRRFFGGKHWHEPIKWHNAAIESGERRRVFCASMADVFEPRDDLMNTRAQLFSLIKTTSELDWLILTKRPYEIMPLMSIMTGDSDWTGFEKEWPNVWLGVTVEDMQHAWQRIPYLSVIGASVRFLSVEPMLGPVVLTAPMFRPGAEGPKLQDKIDWVICGGESGTGARPMSEAWARDLKRQCNEANIPFFMKQMGGTRDKRGELDQLPEDLRAREFPRAKAVRL